MYQRFTRKERSADLDWNGQTNPLIQLPFTGFKPLRYELTAPLVICQDRHMLWWVVANANVHWVMYDVPIIINDFSQHRINQKCHFLQPSSNTFTVEVLNALYVLYINK